MKKTELMMLVLSLSLLVAHCSSSDTKDCDCSKVDQSKEEEKAESKPAGGETASADKSDRSGSGSEAASEPAKSETTKPAEATSSGPADQKQPAKTDSGSESSTVATAPSSSESSESGANGNFPPPKTPIAAKPLNTASTILGGSEGTSTASRGESEGNSATTTGSGSGATSESGSESGTDRDQIRKIDRTSEEVLPPAFTPARGSQSSNTQPAPTGAGSSPAKTSNSSATTVAAASTTTQPSSTNTPVVSPAPAKATEPVKVVFQCDPYEEETKTMLCRGNSSSLKGDAVLEFDSRKLGTLFLGLDIIVRSGEVDVSVPGGKEGKATPERSFVFLGQVKAEGGKVAVKVKADPNEARNLDYIARLIYHSNK
jgi:hypothetical protein